MRDAHNPEPSLPLSTTELSVVFKPSTCTRYMHMYQYLKSYAAKVVFNYKTYSKALIEVFLIFICEKQLNIKYFFVF